MPREHTTDLMMTGWDLAKYSARNTSGVSSLALTRGMVCAPPCWSCGIPGPGMCRCASLASCRARSCMMAESAAAAASDASQSVSPAVPLPGVASERIRFDARPSVLPPAVALHSAMSAPDRLVAWASNAHFPPPRRIARSTARRAASAAARLWACNPSKLNGIQTSSCWIPDVFCPPPPAPQVPGSESKTHLHTPKAVTYHEQSHYCRFMIGHSLGRIECRCSAVVIYNV